MLIDIIFTKIYHCTLTSFSVVQNIFEGTSSDSDTDGCAIAQAVNHWLPTTVARAHVWAARGVCGVQNGTGAGFR
jgi:hypothetical protein